MMSLWVIDAGNTRLKLREIRDNQIHRSIIIRWDQLNSDFLQSIKGDKAIYSKVVSSNKLSPLLLLFDQVIEIDNDVITEQFNLTTKYKTLHQLGVDRLLASLGARLLFEHHEKIAVINAGTATTIEIIENDTHIGGMIIAGNQLMLNSLASAHQLPKLNVQSSTELGTDSITCMQTGLAFMNQGLVLALLKDYKVNKIVVCGGNSPQFVDLDASITLIPDLIMQTLHLIAQKLDPII